mgnify:CR=1 FL=1
MSLIGVSIFIFIQLSDIKNKSNFFIFLTVLIFILSIINVLTLKGIFQIILWDPSRLQNDLYYDVDENEDLEK